MRKNRPAAKRRAENFWFFCTEGAISFYLLAHVVFLKIRFESKFQKNLPKNAQKITILIFEYIFLKVSFGKTLGKKVKTFLSTITSFWTNILTSDHDVA